MCEDILGSDLGLPIKPTTVSPGTSPKQRVGPMDALESLCVVLIRRPKTILASWLVLGAASRSSKWRAVSLCVPSC